MSKCNAAEGLYTERIWSTHGRPPPASNVLSASAWLNQSDRYIVNGEFSGCLPYSLNFHTRGMRHGTWRRNRHSRLHSSPTHNAHDDGWVIIIHCFCKGPI